jgi:hypothetical protein
MTRKRNLYFEGLDVLYWSAGSFTGVLNSFIEVQEVGTGFGTYNT